MRTFVILGQFFSDVSDELVGDCVRVVKLSPDAKERIYRDNCSRIARIDLEAGYDYAIINIYDPVQKIDSEAVQEVLRAIVLLQIIQPTPLARHLTGLITEIGDYSNFFFTSSIGMGTCAYVGASNANARISRDDVRKTKVMWPQIQLVCQQWNKHVRILQTIRYFEAGIGNYNPAHRHILFYSGLECLLSTSSDYSTQQVRQRVLNICPHVTAHEIKEISSMRGKFVHSGAIIENGNQKEWDLIDKLERVLRCCLYHVLADQESLELFSEPQKIKASYPVEVDEATRKPTGRKLFI